MTAKLTDGERLVKLETKMDVLLTNQKEQSEGFKELTTKLDLLLPTYATKKELEKELEELRKTHSLQKWLAAALSGALCTILTFLIQSYFNK